MTDSIHAALVELQAEITDYQWTPAHSVSFTPAVLERTFGDGRALFRITTINNRPRYWIVRGDSAWSESGEGPDGEDNLVIDEIDDIVQAIADEFGGLPNMEDEHDSECYVDHTTGKPFDPINIVYPQIDDRTGNFWQRIDWPDMPGVVLVPHPFDPTVRVLPEPVAACPL